MLIRIVRRAPAPIMDGFDVEGFRVEGVYDVDHRLGRYLILAGYAEALRDEVHDISRRERLREP